jgi:DNA modification methylase
MQIRDRIVELRRVRAADLIENPRNWRRHPEPQRRALGELLDQIGYADACLARDTSEGLVLVDGHLRKDMDPDALLPVLVIDVTEAEADTLLASLDPLAAMAIGDPGALEALLASALVPEAILDELARAHLGIERRGLTHPDAIPARPAASTAKPGMGWALGRHRLVCGDARSTEDLERLMAGEAAGMLLTDPPYGVSYTGKTRDRFKIANDEARGLEALLAGAFAAIDRALRPGASIYVFHPAGALSLSFGQAFVQVGWRLHQTIIWAKDRMVLGHADYHFRHEPIIHGYKPGGRRRGRGHAGWYGGDDQDSVLEVPRPAASREHPTAKPVELLGRLIANSSRPGSVVLDPFAGSGSTMIAAEELGRRAFLLECDPAYCEVIVSRFEAFTGEKAAPIDG